MEGEKEGEKSFLPLALCVTLFLTLVLLAFTASASPDDKPLKIREVVIRDEEGNPITETTRGRFIFIDVVLENVEPYAYVSQPFLLTARLTYGSPPKLMGLSGYKGSLAPGEEINPTPGLQIPPGGPRGTYKVKVMVFSDWPAFNGTVVAEPVEVSLLVG